MMNPYERENAWEIAFGKSRWALVKNLTSFALVILFIIAAIPFFVAAFALDLFER